MSKDADIRKRRREVRRLYLNEGLEAPEIAERLVEDGTIVSKSWESAARLVRADVAAIKAGLASARSAQAEDDEKASPGSGADSILLRQLERLNAAYREFQMIIDDKSTTQTIIDSPNGTTTIIKPTYSATTVQKAIKDKATISKMIAAVETEIEERRRAAAETAQGKGGVDGPSLVIIEGDESIAELIRQNSGVN